MNPVYGETATVPHLNEFALYPVDVQFPAAESANRFRGKESCEHLPG